VSTLSLGTLIGDLQLSLELPHNSWDVPQGGSRFLLTCLSVTLFHLVKGVHCSLEHVQLQTENGESELTHKDRDKDRGKLYKKIETKIQTKIEYYLQAGSLRIGVGHKSWWRSPQM